MPALRTRPLFSIAVLAVLCLQAGCGRSSKDPMKDLKPFAGTWKVVALDRNGEKSDTDALKDMTVKVEGDKFKFVENSKSESGPEAVTARSINTEEYVLQVNPAKAGDIDFINAAENDKSRFGLFDFQGNTLRICLASIGKPRPGQIASGDDVTIFVLERQP